MMRMKTCRISLLALAAALAPVGARAQSAAGQAAGSGSPAVGGNPCAADQQKFCAGAKGSAMSQCMQQHSAELSASCKNLQTLIAGLMKNHAAGMNPGGMSCQQDQAKFCKDAKGPAVLDCLQSHRAALSKDCESALKQHDERMKAFKTACGADQAKFCKDVPLSAVGGCLHQHKEEVSQACRDFFQRNRDAAKADRPRGAAAAGTDSGSKGTPAGN